MYLVVADIANPDLFACGSRTWISLDIGLPPPPPQTVIRPPLLGVGGVDTVCTGLPDRCDSSTPCVGCVVWSQVGLVVMSL